MEGGKWFWRTSQHLFLDNFTSLVGKMNSQVCQRNLQDNVKIAVHQSFTPGTLQICRSGPDPLKTFMNVWPGNKCFVQVCGLRSGTSATHLIFLSKSVPHYDFALHFCFVLCDFCGSINLHSLISFLLICEIGRHTCSHSPLVNHLLIDDVIT